MLDSKFKEKEYLREYSLDIALFKKFDLDVKDVIPVRKVFIVITDEGQYILKRIDYSVDKLLFINDGLQYISNNGFDRVLKYRKSKNNRIYEEYNGDIYCVMELVQGKESVYSNPVDVSVDTKAIAGLHKASRGFLGKFDECDLRGKLPLKLEKELEEIIFIKNMVNRYGNKNEFDEIFINNVDNIIDKGRKTLNYLNTTNYYSLLQQEDKIAFCHHDLAYHNILINDNEAYFIDFDYAIIDLKVHDLANFIIKVIKDFAYDMEKAEKIIAEYREYNSLEDEELNILYSIMAFPHKIFDLIKNYYFKEKIWEYTTFLNRFKEKLQYIKEEEEFLEKFKSKYLL